MGLSGWAILFLYYWPAEWHLASIPSTILSIVGLILVLLFRGGKVTALLGKAVVFIAAVQLLVVYVGSLTITLDTAEWWLLYAIVSGLILERVSPHQQFYSWMFLGIATKVQLGLVSGVMGQFNVAGGLFPVTLWWVTVVLLFISVPIAAMRKQRLYRFVTILSSVVSILLLVDVASRITEISVVGLFLALAAILWPPVIDRLVGHKIFA